MPIDESFKGLPNILQGLSVVFALKSFVILFAVFYVVFSLILYRQIQLMDRSLPTPIGPFLKFIGILQIGIALAFLFILIGAF